MFRVLARAAAIQLEEIAANHAVAGKAAATQAHTVVRSTSKAEPPRNEATSPTIATSTSVKPAQPPIVAVRSDLTPSQQATATPVADLAARPTSGSTVRLQPSDTPSSAPVLDLPRETPSTERAEAEEKTLGADGRVMEGRAAGVSTTAKDTIGKDPVLPSTQPKKSVVDFVKGESPAESSKTAQARAAAQTVPIQIEQQSRPADSKTTTSRDHRDDQTKSTAAELVAEKTAELSSPAASDPVVEQTTPPGPTSTAIDSENTAAGSDAIAGQDEEPQVMLRASKVPSSRIGRLFHYGSLAASMGWGAATESIRRTATGGGDSQGSVFMSDANVRRLVGSLSKMRGAALKLGQFMSIQDNNMLPPEIERVLQQVQAQANYMPDWQMERVMTEELGPEWESLFSSFDKTPIASASIGQVHRATLKSTGQAVAVKVQFPGVKTSIESDLSYLTPLLRSSAVLPKGMFLQNTIATMKRELADECDYTMEAVAGRKFRDYLKGDEFFVCPEVVDEASRERVLTTTWMPGKPLSKMKGMSQETRDKIGRNILRLCLMELFHFRFMQTDPNWANFLYDAQFDRLGLIDFGASRPYSKEFMDGWFRLLNAAVKNDRAEMESASRDIGYLTGEENDLMINAHVDSMALLATPFASKTPYVFANQTITDTVRGLIPIMLKHRLTPPPPETYSLNRKLSGAFLMCAKLGATVDCGKLWEEYVADYKMGPE